MIVNILGRATRLTEMSQMELDKCIGQEKGDAGGFDIKAQTIDVVSTLEMEYKRRIVIHEIQHALLGYSGLTNIINNDELEEALCDLSENWLQILRDPQIKALLNI